MPIPNDRYSMVLMFHPLSLPSRTASRIMNAESTETMSLLRYDDRNVNCGRYAATPAKKYTEPLFSNSLSPVLRAT